MYLCSLFLWPLISLVLSLVQAYTPAQPTNSTLQDLGGTSTSRLTLQWYSNGSDTEFVYYLLAGSSTNGISQGVLVHFSEDVALNTTTTTPWIAFISCDANSTNASQELDIFTLARDSGALAALLYSVRSESCAINPAYTDPDNDFDHVFDIFATQSFRVSNFIEYEFAQFGQNGSYYGTYNATMLNATASVVNESIALGNPVAPGPLFATLQAFNATASPNNGSSVSGSAASAANDGSSNSQKTGLAMIILYAITGCVSALFCLVIISGAIRAIRHPERYGPRMPDHGGTGDPGQSRARGLGRAILDTFPVVKFGSGEQVLPVSRPKDVEVPHVQTTAPPVTPQPNSLELDDVAGSVGRLAETRDLVSQEPGGQASAEASQGETTPTSRLRSVTDPMQLPRSENSGGVMPEAIGRETCPICIVDFEEGDDLRVLPCEGKHRFHQTCVDPWLLELSGSCPLCRQDFHALEALLSGEINAGEPSAGRRHSQALSIGGMQNRFSRYLRFARGRQDRRGEPMDSSEIPNPVP